MDIAPQCSPACTVSRLLTFGIKAWLLGLSTAANHKREGHQIAQGTKGYESRWKARLPINDNWTFCQLLYAWLRAEICQNRRLKGLVTLD